MSCQQNWHEIGAMKKVVRNWWTTTFSTTPNCL